MKLQFVLPDHPLRNNNINYYNHLDASELEPEI